MSRFVSPGGSTAVTIEDEAWASIIERCLAAGRAETGGILVGRYTEWRDRAIIVEATGPPRDSRFWPFAFWRGYRGLRGLLKERWTTSKTHYIGEWHFHPYTSAAPSETDIAQMRSFASDPVYRCPRPVLVVVGGDPSAIPEVAVAVIQDPTVVHLEPVRPSTPLRR